MAAGHFFVGLGAGIAILAVPVLTLTPGLNVPQRMADWINGPPSQPIRLFADDTAANRPQHGYVAGEATPGPAGAPPTLQPAQVPTAVPPRGQSAQTVPLPFAEPIGGATLRTGVIRSNGTPVYVRRVAGVDSGDDPMIADGSPVLVSTGSGLQVGNDLWRAVRGLNGIVGWVPNSQVAVDGEATPAPVIVAANATATPVSSGARAQATAAPGQQRGMISNTDGVGVVLRNSPNDADRSRSGLMDGMTVSVLEWSGTDWVHVRADNGQTGWIPARYVVAAG